MAVKNSYKVGIDIGGTFTDIMAVHSSGKAIIHKTLSTPADPSEGFVNGLKETAALLNLSFESFITSIDTIVHGTTVATNALLTLRGAKTALVTTQGFRDALEMRRGIREEQYNNHYKNVTPLAPRYLRFGLKERIDANGNILTAPDFKQLDGFISVMKKEKVESVAVCFLNSYLNQSNEQEVTQYLRNKLSGVFVTGSYEVLPGIRFYERVSTTTVSAFVGPIVAGYFNKLKARLKTINYTGGLLIMQSNGGVVSVEEVMKNPAVTVLSGPAAAPTAGEYYSGMLGFNNCITADMGGTSFDAAMVVNSQCVTGTEGSINRYRIALPSLDIITIGAGGGSIGWIDEGNLLHMGPQSAGAMPGPVCYSRGGKIPACTDADLILGYLNPDFFAGGKLKLDKTTAEKAIETLLAKPLKINTLQAAAGMFRIINSNMAQGVREISIERGYDPREFLFIVAGGAGSLHASEICKELEISLFLVPNVSSVFCAAGMLLGDLKLDYIKSYYTSFNNIDKKHFLKLLNSMKKEGTDALVKRQGVPENNIVLQPVLEMRYVGQYHEVPLEVSWNDLTQWKLEHVFEAFHHEHNRQFGYSLKEENAPMELINIRLRVTGKTERPEFKSVGVKSIPLAKALKEMREIYIPERLKMVKVPVYDGDLPIYNTTIEGPCIIEKITTSVLLTDSWNCEVDSLGSFIVYDKIIFPQGYLNRKTEKSLSKTLVA
jgi:N-methylhydantoinase A